MKKVFGWILGVLLVFARGVEADEKECTSECKIYVQLDQLEINEHGIFYLDPISGIQMELSNLQIGSEGYFSIIPEQVTEWRCYGCGRMNKAGTPRMGCIYCSYIQE
ncbi:MAG: hypothetical protein ACOYK9_02670 [Chlamydiia bacterium]